MCVHVLRLDRLISCQPSRILLVCVTWCSDTKMGAELFHQHPVQLRVGPVASYNHGHADQSQLITVGSQQEEKGLALTLGSEINFTARVVNRCLD